MTSLPAGSVDCTGFTSVAAGTAYVASKGSYCGSWKNDVINFLAVGSSTSPNLSNFLISEASFDFSSTLQSGSTGNLGLSGSGSVRYLTYIGFAQSPYTFVSAIKSASEYPLLCASTDGMDPSTLSGQLSISGGTGGQSEICTYATPLSAGMSVVALGTSLQSNLPACGTALNNATNCSAGGGGTSCYPTPQGVYCSCVLTTAAVTQGCR